MCKLVFAHLYNDKIVLHTFDWGVGGGGGKKVFTRTEPIAVQEKKTS